MLTFRTHLFAALGLIVAGLMASGCAPHYAGGAYASPRDYGRASHTERGIVVDTRRVLVRSDGRGGAVVGAVAGGAAGAALGGDTGGSIAGGLAGALIGGILGSEIDRSSSAHEGIEYVIELDNGGTVTVVQHPSRYYEPGTRVHVIFGEHVRVAPAYDDDYRRDRYDRGRYDEDPYYDEPYDPGYR